MELTLDYRSTSSAGRPAVAAGDLRLVEHLRPHHAYHQSLVYKIFNASKPHGAFVSFEQSLEMIGRIDRLSRGLQQIVYLTGWQYAGHDSKYPAWFEVNPDLARAGEDDPLQSMRWLMDEARARYGAELSVHVNMDDAYRNSPLWETYVKHDVIDREMDGRLRLGRVFGGEQSYLISKAREWESGFAQQRLDRLLEMLPIAAAGTLHIDVFYPRDNPLYGITQEQDLEAMKQIIRYLHGRGVDVTKEWFDYEFAGLVPMVWHFNLDETDRLNYPAELICGGGSGWNRRYVKSIPDRERHTGLSKPEQGCLYEEAWGQSIDLEPTMCDRYPFSRFVDDFCRRTLPWHFLNRHRVVQHVHSREHYEVHFAGDVCTDMRKTDRHFTLMQGDRLLVENGDVCMPASWRDGEWLAYSHGGCDREWQLGDDWSSVGRATVQTLEPVERVRSARDLPVQHGRIRLNLAPGEAVVLMPA